ncbi:hypothetical protein LOTGIDRAFT_163262 [Lottia gigantea]|uniref:Uncharacterized protein n=1 Tax=Lottia gigantea TaxID=225164 RepID=V4AF02_LOTGI|nr:hypothetical protein LOTGIDRAFT_163262 [Lottia gigantea]ESO91901.1 hypothetical protein LOTGIDRAFT_163262 [Lottia gigantea]
MLKTIIYPKDFDSVSGWIPYVGDGSVLKEPVRNLANDADLARVRVVARNTIQRVARAANHEFEKRVIQYNNIVENNRWGNYINWKLYPLLGLLEDRKVSIGLPYKIHLQREINDDKIFFCGGISAAVKAANAKKAADPKAAEERRHNLIMEKEAKGSGVGDMIGTIK